MQPLQVKQCCANVYGSEAARFLLGDSFHPGGVELTGRLAQLAKLTARSVVLDVASGKGTSALYLTETIGCRVIGVDLSPTNVEQASAEATARSLNHQVSFLLGDAERLPFEMETFDAIICECAFCTFPDKQRSSDEFARVLRPAGVVAISDLTRTRAPLPELDGLLAWIACIGDAQPLEQYGAWLTAAGFELETMERHDHCLIDMVNSVRSKLLVADVLKGLGKLNVPELDTEQAKKFAHAVFMAVQAGQLGYGVVVARKGYA
jgi:ubiquinone/menaquinone biosynthesis C-methylase UbiE